MYENIKVKKKNKKVKKIILIPEVNIKIAQLKKTSKVCPISGWIINKDATTSVVINESKYLRYKLVYFWLLRIILIKIIKKGFTSSIGWNLGKKFKSIHLFDPLTSIPMNGTKIRKISEIKKIIKEYLKSFSWLRDDKTKIMIIPRKIKIKCLKKNA